MAETEIDHRFGQCRCCLDVGYHKDIAEPYHRNGARETYRETFLKCFSLVLSTNTKLTNMICTSCISRLNDASEFVTMVVESEKQLLKQINNTSDIEFINVTEERDGGVCVHEEDDNNQIKKEDDIDCSNVEDEEMDRNNDQGKDIYTKNNRSVQGEDKGDNNNDVSIKQESDMELDNVEDDEGIQEEVDNNVIKVEEEVDSSNVKDEEIRIKNDQGKEIHTKNNRTVQEKDQGDNNGNVLIKQESDMEFDSVEDKGIDLQTDGNMQDENDVSLKEEDDIESNDIDGEEVNTQVTVANSQAEKTEDHNKSIHDKLKMVVESTLGQKRLQIRLTRLPNCFFKPEKHRMERIRNVNSTTDLKLTTQEAEHIAADMDLSRKKQKTHTKCHPDEINNTNTSTECLDAVIKSDNIFKNYIYRKTNKYSCDLCKYGTNMTKDFNYHVKAHSATTHYICDTCCYMSTQRNALISHFRLHIGAKSHTGEKPYPCKICDKKSSYKSDITRHIMTHTGEKPHACKICDKKFSRNAHLKTHVRTHTGIKPYACKMCDKKFSLSHNLKTHVRRHTGKKPYACDICDKKFADNSDLTKHVRTHTGEKRYACDICDKKFARNYHLTVHVRTHTGEKSYACRICDKKFTRNSSLTRHVRTHANQKHNIRGVE